MNLLLGARTLANTIKFGAKKYAPEICITLGVTGVITSTVMACCKTKKTEAIMEETRAKLAEIRETAPAETKGAEVTKEYARMTGKMIRNYAIPVAVMSLSVGLIFKSYGIMKSRNIAMAAAYSALDDQFKGYRNRVANKVGTETENDIYYGIEKEKVERVIETEDGKTKKVKEEVEVITEDVLGPWTRIFEEGNNGWEKNPIYTANNLQCMERWLNDQLKSREVMSANEVLTYLGFPPTREGVVWGYRKKTGVDKVIDFGITADSVRELNRRFNDGLERAVILDLSKNIENLYVDWKKPTCVTV